MIFTFNNNNKKVETFQTLPSNFFPAVVEHKMPTGGRSAQEFTKIYVQRPEEESASRVALMLLVA